MGKIKYLPKIMDLFKKNPVVSIRDIKLLTKNENYSNVLLNYLLKKGEIKRIEKGFYTLYNDPTLIVFAIRPSYIGLQAALSIHNLWEQETNTIIVTPKKIRIGKREVFDTNVIVRRIDKKYFFGYDLINYDNFLIPVSDKEKTIIDLIYFRQPIEEKIFSKIKIDKKKMKEYIKKYPKFVKKRVLKIFKLDD
ncbi:MAG: hypothetical protein KQA41_03410 [Candidatus Aenigmarchaeota archaeon]|nr:hypothetical protein [Candidatus Aenigmarchaeota archaeon]MBU5689245.1 hypothetical protein [Candidatus Aenigmarchaeota archaeon]